MNGIGSSELPFPFAGSVWFLFVFQVRRTFADLPFLTNERSVSIMDGVDEGIFSWFTINFLSNRLGGSVDDMAAALDLGGGSTQVTFATLNDSQIWETSAQYLHPINVFHKNLSVYTHR